LGLLADKSEGIGVMGDEDILAIPWKSVPTKR